VWDAVVAGAGPAGAAAAQTLARAGVRVLLADAVSPAHKVGEALPGAALRLLQALDFPRPGPEGPHTPIRGTLSAWGSSDLVATDALRDRDGPGWRLDRSGFDASLRAAARGSGAGWRAAGVAAMMRDGSEWTVRLTSAETFKARWLIDATGRRATVARRLGARRLRDARLVACYAVGQAGADRPLSRTLIEAVPNGWWYASRLPSGAPVAGLHVGPDDARRLATDAQAWRAALAGTRHVAERFLPSSFGSLLPPLDAGGSRLDRLTGAGWIACGDAALAFDPVSGQGILAALHGGMMAARAVLGTLAGDCGALTAYGSQMERVRRAYEVQWAEVYRNEQRWPAERFWAGRR